MSMNKMFFTSLSRVLAAWVHSFWACLWYTCCAKEFCSPPWAAIRCFAILWYSWVSVDGDTWSNPRPLIIPPPPPKVEWGYTGFTLTSVCMSVHPSAHKVSGFFFFKLLAQFIWYLAFTLVGWPLLIFVLLAPISALWRPNILAQMGFPELCEKTIGSIHFIPGIYTLMGWVSLPLFIFGSYHQFRPPVAKYFAGNPIFGMSFDPYSFLCSYRQLQLLWCLIQLSAVITRSNIIRYYINNYRIWGRILIRCWIHWRHPISRPNGRATGCLLWIFVRKLTAL